MYILHCCQQRSERELYKDLRWTGVQEFTDDKVKSIDSLPFTSQRTGLNLQVAYQIKPLSVLFLFLTQSLPVHFTARARVILGTMVLFCKICGNLYDIATINIHFFKQQSPFQQRTCLIVRKKLLVVLPDRKVLARNTLYSIFTYLRCRQVPIAA